MSKVILGLVVALVLVSAPVWAADTYKIDPVHSTLGFSVRHMMLSNVTGEFDKYEGQIIYDPNDLANSKVNVTIQTASIDTRNEKRNGDLRSPDFFDAAKFPTITFVSKKVTSSEIVGDLIMKGVTKEVHIPVVISGPLQTMPGKSAIGISGGFILNRQDYGVSYNKTLDQGGLAVGNEVTVNINVEADKQ